MQKMSQSFNTSPAKWMSFISRLILTDMGGVETMQPHVRELSPVRRGPGVLPLQLVDHNGPNPQQAKGRL